MDVQLKEIIDKIKNDGIRKAEEEAARIIGEAQDEASEIIRKAEENAKLIRNNTEAEIHKMENSGKGALRQAGRDLILTVKGEIRSIFDRLLEKEVRGVLNVELLSNVVLAAVKNIPEQEKDEIDVLIPAELSSKVEPALIAKLKAEIASGIEIKPFKELDAGFRIAMKDGSAFYNFSDKEIAAMLGRYLNPRFLDFLSA